MTGGAGVFKSLMAVRMRRRVLVWACLKVELASQPRSGCTQHLAEGYARMRGACLPRTRSKSLEMAHKKLRCGPTRELVSPRRAGDWGPGDSQGPSHPGKGLGASRRNARTRAQVVQCRAMTPVLPDLSTQTNVADACTPHRAVKAGGQQMLSWRTGAGTALHEARRSDAGKGASMVGVGSTDTSC